MVTFLILWKSCIVLQLLIIFCLNKVTIAMNHYNAFFLSFFPTIATEGLIDSCVMMCLWHIYCISVVLDTLSILTFSTCLLSKCLVIIIHFGLCTRSQVCTHTCPLPLPLSGMCSTLGLPTLILKKCSLFILHFPTVWYKVLKCRTHNHHLIHPFHPSMKSSVRLVKLVPCWAWERMAVVQIADWAFLNSLLCCGVFKAISISPFGSVLSKTDIKFRGPAF